MSRQSFSIEQWELIRRLRNSGLTKEQLANAYDDLDKIEQDLGPLYTIPSNLFANLNFQNQISNMANNGDMSNLLTNNLQLFQIAKNLASFNSNTNRTINSTNNSNINNNINSNQILSAISKHESKNEQNDNSVASTIVNNHFLSLIDSDKEAKEVEEFRA
jgi:hypothetical protein